LEALGRTFGNFGTTTLLGDAIVSNQKQAKYLGFDISTTSVTALVADGNGVFGTASVPMYGACQLHGQSAHDLNYIPLLLAFCLQRLQVDGWSFSQPGTMGLSVRQHDLVILGEDGFTPLLPALDWRFEIDGYDYAAALNKLPAVNGSVGTIESRFALAKLDWLLEHHAGLRDYLELSDPAVMLTGDWIAGCLCDSWAISTSDGRCNGLIEYETGDLARGAILAARMNADWFNEATPGGHPCGYIGSTDNLPEWGVVSTILDGWDVVASLADNHAGAFGSGLGESDEDEGTVVASFGTSGTVVRQKRAGATFVGKCARFDFFGRDLALSMLPSCGAAFSRLCAELGEEPLRIDQLAWVHVAQNGCGPLGVVALSESATGKDTYPDCWSFYDPGRKAAAVILAIAAEMAGHVDVVINEVAATPITRVAMTGGLSQSPLLRQAFRVALEILGRTVTLVASDRDIAPNQAAAWGAMMTGWRYADSSAAAIQHCCPTKSLTVDTKLDDSLRPWLSRFML